MDEERYRDREGKWGVCVFVMCLCVVGAHVGLLSAEATSKLHLKFENDYAVQTHRSVERLSLGLISHTLLSVVHSCYAKGLALGVDYVT